MAACSPAKRDIVDPQTGLSANDRENVTETWTLYRQDAHRNVVFLFESLFTKHPDYQKMFKSIPDIKANELHKNPVAAAHALAVGYFLSAIIDSIEDGDTMIQLMRKNARNHIIRPVTPEHFLEFGNVLIEQLQEKMRLRMTQSVVTSWKRFFELKERVTRQVYSELSANAEAAANAAKNP